MVLYYPTWELYGIVTDDVLGYLYSQCMLAAIVCIYSIFSLLIAPTCGVTVTATISFCTWCFVWMWLRAGISNWNCFRSIHSRGEIIPRIIWSCGWRGLPSGLFSITEDHTEEDIIWRGGGPKHVTATSIRAVGHVLLSG